MGEKKLEYGMSFNYHTFFLGKPSFRSSSPRDIPFFTFVKYRVHKVIFYLYYLYDKYYKFDCK